MNTAPAPAATELTIAEGRTIDAQLSARVHADTLRRLRNRRIVRLLLHARSRTPGTVRRAWPALGRRYVVHFRLGSLLRGRTRPLQDRRRRTQFRRQAVDGCFHGMRASRYQSRPESLCFI